ncbi:MAG: hypothetical protein JST70_17170 [Bacteroidetes bacterium]|nr:hypothetical protein [Bacteroidota bacterium]
MKAKFISGLEKKIYHEFSKDVHLLLEANCYPDISKIAAWLLSIFKSRLTGKETFTSFDKATSESIITLLSDGDIFYFELFRSGSYINERTKERESKQPFTDVVQAIYESLFLDDRINDDKLIIYSELRTFVEEVLGRELAYDVSLQTYEEWLNIDKHLEIEYKIKEAWLNSISITKIRSEQTKFLKPRTRTSLTAIVSLIFSHRNQDKAAKDYIAKLKKLSKDSVFNYVEAATKDADMVHFTREINLQRELSQKLGTSAFLMFIDYLKYPIAQDHAVLLINNLDDYIDIIREICSRKPRKTSKEYLLLFALKNYFDFIMRSLSDLKRLAEYKPYGQINDSTLTEEAKKEAQHILDDWEQNRIQNSFNDILNIIFPKPSMSSSKYFLPFIDWLNSHSKLYLTHPGVAFKRKIIDVLNDSFQERLNMDSKAYHYMIDQVNGEVNHEGLRKMVSTLIINPSDISFRDKLYECYIKHLESKKFYWSAIGDIDNIEAINQAYFFSQVLASYENSFERWQDLFSKHKNTHEGWLSSSSDSTNRQREPYLLTAGVGMAYFNYEHEATTEASIIIFNVVNIALSQLRSTYNRSVLDYETPLWFSGVTVAKFAVGERDRFIDLIAQRIDSIKLFIRIVYEFLLNANVVDLSPSMRSCIKERIQNEFYIIESSKVDVDLRKDFEYYEKMKQTIFEKLATPANPNHLLADQFS